MSTRVSDAVAKANERAARDLPFDDSQDFEDARRGFIGALPSAVVTAADGRVVWDNDAYAFLRDPCPPSAHPSLWRQGQLVSQQGLFEVTAGIYQVRGLDLSNITFVEGDKGVIVIDPLISTETAAAALELYRTHRGQRPVTGVIYTHSHVDHFGGVKGVVDEADVTAGLVPVLAPAGFLEHAVSENVYAGIAMGRRALYMYGAQLPKGPAGQIGTGLGMTTSMGSITLIPPTVDITATGQQETVDGVRMIFQLTPGTEAPSEMNFFFPDSGALCMAENATHNMHNVLTLRGAVVRDARNWSRYLGETLVLFGDSTTVAFASHHWPTWGRGRVVAWLSGQRDLYAYLHDQTLRLVNQGYTGPEIAEMLELPPGLARMWHARGYYGSFSHNVKAVYQRYMGWFDGNPAHLWEHPPAEAARRYVDFMGGADQVLAKARQSFEAGDFRWVVQVVNHVLFADPANTGARELQADALEQLGYGAENGTWRSFYLSGASELRDGIVPAGTTIVSADLLAALTIEQVFDSLAIRLNGPRAAGTELVLGFDFTDSGEKYTLTLSNGALTYVNGCSGPGASMPAATIRLTRPVLLQVLSGGDAAAMIHAGQITIGGSPGALATLIGLLEEPAPNFPIVTP